MSQFTRQYTLNEQDGEESDESPEVRRNPEAILLTQNDSSKSEPIEDGCNISDGSDMSTKPS